MINDLLNDLERAIKARNYEEVDQIGNQMLDISPSEDADRFINDIISSASTICDAEDEIKFQFLDLKSTLKKEDLSDEDEKEVDGL
jgi:hypothetical protein